jgi:hypothetical protein
LTDPPRRFRITHPFHPLFTRQYELVDLRRGWGREHAAFYDDNDDLIAVPIAWTDLAGEEDPFVVLSEGRACFRVVDLLVLVELIEDVWT